jgi:hypothetical protein
MGLPDKSSDSGITRYLAPQFLPTRKAIEAGLFPEKGILVFEEINRVPSDTVSVLYPLLLEGRINNHCLAPGWKIGVTMNPDNLNYTVNALDDALIDRFISLEITADLEDYTNFSIDEGSNADVLAFLNACPDMLLVSRELAESNPLAKNPTPRGWTKVQKILNSCDLEQKQIEQLVTGIVGPEAAASFFGWLRTNSVRIPGALDSLEDFEGQKDLFEILLDNNRIDILNIVLKNMVSVMTIGKNHLKNLNSLLEFLPDEFSIMFFKYFISKRFEDYDALASSLPVFDRLADSIVDFVSV